MQHNFWLAKPYGLANQKVCCIQMLLNILKKKPFGTRLEEWLVNTDSDQLVQSSQVGMYRDSFMFVEFLHIEGFFDPHNLVDTRQSGFYGFTIM